MCLIYTVVISENTYGGVSRMANSSRELRGLLDAARASSPMSRIEFRDPIAQFGLAAIAEVVTWLADPRLAAFAVRVIATAGADGAHSEAAAALLAARTDASPAIQRDIDEALIALGVKPKPTGNPPKQTPPATINDNLYERLVDAARSRRTMTYTDAGEIVGLTMRNPHHRRLLGQHLGAISEYETEHGRPMLSALVVQKGEKRAGSGFTKWGEELGLKRAVEDDKTFEVKELDRVFAYWSRPPGPASATGTGAPDFRTRHTQDEPPPSLGPCGFGTSTGQCLNPGRWDREGFLSCTTHALARDPVPFGIEPVP